MNELRLPQAYFQGGEHGQDMLDDVIPSDKYRAEFGDGPVPITHVTHLHWSRNNYDDIWLALAETAVLYDRAREVFGKIDAEYVACLVREYGIVVAEGEDQTLREMRGLDRDNAVYKAPEREVKSRPNHLVKLLVRAGLKITAIRRLVKDQHLWGAYPGWKTSGWDKWKEADELCSEGRSYAWASKELGIPLNQTQAWWIERGWPLSESYAEMTYWWLRQPPTVRNAPNRKALIEEMQRRYPFSHFEHGSCNKRARDVIEGRQPEPERKPEWTTPW